MSENCIFCDQDKLLKQLIAEDDDFYLITSLGQLTDSGHVVLIVKRHVACFGAMKVREINVAQMWLEKLSEANKQEYGNFGSRYEHGIVGQTVKHAHIHVIPAPVSLGDRISMDFLSSDVVVLKDLQQLRKSHRKNKQPYLFWHNLYGYPHVCWNPPAPASYLRKIIAVQLGRPERGDALTTNKVFDVKYQAETIARFKPYFKISRRSRHC